MGSIASVFSTAFGIFGSIMQGRQEKAMYNYQAQVAQNNAVIARQNAADAQAAGAAEEQRRRMQTAQQVGGLRAGAGASGFDVGVGSFVDEFAATEMAGEMDALSIRNDYQRQANNFLRQSGQFTSDADMYKTAGKNAMTSGIIGAAGTVLGGLSTVDSSWFTSTGSTGDTITTGGAATKAATKRKSLWGA